MCAAKNSEFMAAEFYMKYPMNAFIEGVQLTLVFPVFLVLIVLPTKIKVTIRLAKASSLKQMVTGNWVMVDEKDVTLFKKNQLKYPDNVS